jgi:hypothetical protein
MSKNRDERLRRWSHIQGTLFPWLREEVGELTARHERIVLVLDVLGLEAHVPGPPGGPVARRKTAWRSPAPSSPR